MASKDPKFPARGVRKDGDEENAVSGALYVSDKALRFEGGGEKIDLSWQELVLELTQGKQGPVGFTHPEHPDWRFTAYERRILKEKVFRSRTNLRRQIDDFKREQEGIGQVIATMCFIAAFMVASFVVGYMIEQKVPKILAEIPTSQAVSLGEELKPLVEERYTITTSHTNSLKALTELAQSIIPVDMRDEIDLKVHMVEDPAPNAFSLPSGDIYVCTGALQLTDQPEQIAGILVHVIAHIIKRHALRAAITKDGPNLVMQGLLGGGDGIVKSISADKDKMIAQEHSPSLEREADEMAWEMLLEAKINPTGLAKFLVNIRDKVEYEKEGGDLARAYSSHPPTRERFRTLDRKAAYLDSDIKFRTLDPLPVPVSGPTHMDPLDF